MKRYLTLLIIREMKIKTKMRYHLTQVRWPSSKSLQRINIGESVEKREHSYIYIPWWECKLVQPLWKTVCRFLKKTKNRVTIWSCNPVTKSWVWLLTAQKPTKRQGLWKGKFPLLWRPATQVEGCWGSRADSCPKAYSPPLAIKKSKSFYRRREGATCRNSTVSSDSHLETGHAVVWSASSCFKYN